MTSVNPPTPARRESAHTPLAGTLSPKPRVLLGITGQKQHPQTGEGQPLSDGNRQRGLASPAFVGGHNDRWQKRRIQARWVLRNS